MGSKNLKLFERTFGGLLAVWVVIVALAVTAQLSGAEARSKAIFAIQSKWRAHWPWDQGKDAPLNLDRIVGPLAPRMNDVEPGITMVLDPYDFVSRYILVRGVWELESWAEIAKNLPPDGTFIDIGAHIGYYSVKAAAVLGPNGRVVSIEPNPVTLGTLRANVGQAKGGKISVQPVACSDREAVLKFYAAPRQNTGESSLSSKNAGQEGAIAGTYEVRARPLDDIAAELGLTRVDVVKIDVEGAEMLVLKGAKSTLARFHPVLIIELKDYQLKAMDTSTAEVQEWLRSRGYAFAQIVDQNFEFKWSGFSR
jgi:FkbM family methyltransferase